MEKMEKKVKYGQFYTKKSNYIIGNLIKDLDPNKKVVEPFCGEGDLLIFNNECELYDIDPKIENTIERDTLKNPLDYTNKLVVTNPPFLAKNKNKDKSIYDLYKVNDLYKASIKSILSCDGGILIIPLNFLCDEDKTIRNLFFERFEIININIFEETVFDDTSYTVCSFSFRVKEEPSDEVIIKPLILPKNKYEEYTLKKDNGWRIGSTFFDLTKNQKNIGISRLTTDGEPNSNIYLKAIDSGTQEGRISLSYNENHHYGIQSDRSFATIVTDKIYSKKEQLIIINEFNRIIEHYRGKYNSLFLTNFRNSTKLYSRKRISFNVAYKLISYIIKKENL